MGHFIVNLHLVNNSIKPHIAIYPIIFCMLNANTSVKFTFFCPSLVHLHFLLLLCLWSPSNLGIKDLSLCLTFVQISHMWCIWPFSLVINSTQGILVVQVSQTFLWICHEVFKSFGKSCNRDHITKLIGFNANNGSLYLMWSQISNVQTPWLVGPYPIVCLQNLILELEPHPK